MYTTTQCIPNPILEHLRPVFPIFLYLMPGKMVGSVEAAIFIVAGTEDTRPPPAAAELAVAPTTEAVIDPIEMHK